MTQDLIKKVVPLTDAQLKEQVNGGTDYQQLYNMAKGAEKANKDSNGKSSFTPNSDGQTATVTNTQTGKSQTVTVNSDFTGINTKGTGNPGLTPPANPALTPSQQQAAAIITQNGGSITFPNGYSMSQNKQSEKAKEGLNKIITNEWTKVTEDKKNWRLTNDAVVDNNVYSLYNLIGNGNLPKDFFNDINGNPTKPNEGKDWKLKAENKRISALKNKYFVKSPFDYYSPDAKSSKFAIIDSQMFRDKTMQINEKDSLFNFMNGYTDGKPNTLSRKGCKMECVSKIVSDITYKNYSIAEINENFDTNNDGLLSDVEVEKGLNKILPSSQKAEVNYYTENLDTSFFESLANSNGTKYIVVKAEGVANGEHFVNAEGVQERNDGSIEVDYLPSSMYDITNNRKYFLKGNTTDLTLDKNSYLVTEVQVYTIY